MKILFFTLIAGMLFLPLPLSAQNRTDTERVNVSLVDWFTSSNSSWEISDSGFDPTLGKYVSVRSRLDFDETDSNVSIVGVKVKIVKPFYINLSYGYGKIEDARVTDSDWISVPEDSVYDSQFSESVSEGSGETRIFEAGGEYRLIRAGRPYSLSVYAGYLYYSDRLKMRNGVQTLSGSYFGVPPVGYQMTDLNSRYDFHWHILKTGVGGKIKSGRKIEFNGGLYFLNTLRYYGEAYWNLRVGEFRSKKPNFIHEADDGLGVETFINVTFLISRWASISTGYRYFYLAAEDGVDTTYYASGDVGKATLDRVEAERKGPYVRLDVKF